jgi:hypothetical protein
MRSGSETRVAPVRPRWRLRHKRDPLAWAMGRLLAWRLDRQLAVGAAPWRSRAHAARALQLTSPRRRRRLATGLSRILDEAFAPPISTRLGAVVSPSRTQVCDALPQIVALTARLQDAEPVDSRGVAGLQLLITDGAGPFYVAAHRPTLADALAPICEFMDPVD